MKILKDILKIRKTFSNFCSLFLSETDWQPKLESSDPISFMQEFCSTIYKYKSDPIYGLIDFVRSVKSMNYDLLYNNIIHGDCDDQARINW